MCHALPNLLEQSGPEYKEEEEEEETKREKRSQALSTFSSLQESLWPHRKDIWEFLPRAPETTTTIRSDEGG